MPMKIEVCPNCGDRLYSSGKPVDECLNCGVIDVDDIVTISVHTDRELKQAQIEAYEDALSTVKYHLGSQAEYFIKHKITALKQSMEE